MKRKTKIALRLLAVVVVAAGLWQLVPRLLEQRSLYLGKQAYQAQTEERAAALSVQYVGSHLCAQCHQNRHAQWLWADHRTIACETCHGPGRMHIEEGARLPLDTSREACGACHDELDARPRDFPQIDLAQHNSPSVCVTCHNPMGLASQVSLVLPASTPTPSAVTPTAPTSETSGTATPSGVPHPLEGRSDCLMCHVTTGFKPFPADHVGRTSDICLVCHERKGT